MIKITPAESKTAVKSLSDLPQIVRDDLRTIIEIGMIAVQASVPNTETASFTLEDLMDTVALADRLSIYTAAMSIADLR